TVVHYCVTDPSGWQMASVLRTERGELARATVPRTTMKPPSSQDVRGLLGRATRAPRPRRRHPLPHRPRLRRAAAQRRARERAEPAAAAGSFATKARTASTRPSDRPRLRRAPP